MTRRREREYPGVHKYKLNRLNPRTDTHLNRSRPLNQPLLFQHIEHFKSDLVYAGYQPDAYKYIKDENNVYKFTQISELVRSPEQIAEIAALRDTQGDAFVRDLIDLSGNFRDNLNAVTNKLLFTYEPVTFDANESKLQFPFSWTMYEQYQPNPQTEMVPTNQNKFVHYTFFKNPGL